ncbi:MAG: hypothetical protein M5U26_22020 [Planctomycetota bacterium]|nr:hypothetical protein [Planctomycetota bacterium]
MPVIVYCKECARKIRAPDQPGKFGRCPTCNTRVLIPEQDEAGPPPPEALNPKYREQAAQAEASAAPEEAAPAGAEDPAESVTPPEAHEPVAAPKSAPPPAPAKPQPPPKSGPETRAEGGAGKPRGP